MDRRAFLLAGGAALAVGAGGVATWRAFDADLARERARIAGKSAIAQTRFGPIEYAIAGDGPPVLMIHGTGGGFDQGLDFSRRIAEAGFRIVAPSRFGYLRSSFPDDPSSEHQADAFADLLDALGIDQVAAIGGSAGALSAIQFALRWPKRCAALIPLVPAAYVPGQPPPAPAAPFVFDLALRALKSDFLYWSGLKTAARSMVGTLLATDPALLDAASAEERQRVRDILWHMLPVSDRANGFINDARLTGGVTPLPLEDIQAPTLAVSLEDDRFGTYRAAWHIADSTPNGRLVSWPAGGHVWVGHDADVAAEIAGFLRSV